ncbi:D-isomer specific 2-hydroxyacid dehydrogenase [Sphingomonas sp. LH128]|uniref:D-isomer specific 2-hydroxyacid dehydrogenase n=1 Tax=Novosphingobium resinovorum TaxID=158500 RepID=A0A031K7W7_9SPHN|nr:MULTISPECIES: 2-hydroxyacid dehydrogenase [Sphingomonadaceae]EJU14500.1 D-isomer specific 2-hydroxyacid dehydrogenase [Sphingomonas sp. LH128]EZP84712.1 D-isomer specific 2-hydroxyacid dehydrogenase [Novosphingobium resinovorum]
MRIAVYGTRSYDRTFLSAANADHGFDLQFLDAPLTLSTARLAEGHEAVCVFVNDKADRAVLEALASAGVRLLALRCAGYNNVDLAAADRLGIAVVRVPAYSPHAVAEFTVGLLLSLDRKIHRAWSRVRENNFALDGLVGRNLHGRVAGVVGTGQIGALVARTLRAGFGCDVLASDPVVDEGLVEIGVRYVEREALLRESEIVTLHCPLTPDTYHLIDAAVLAAARPGLVVVNTSRGALIDTAALIEALKQRRVGGVALDVYEQEAGVFFDDLSSEIIDDDLLQRLLTFPNVLMTGHQAFLTEEALDAIARTTLQSVSDFAAGRALPNRIRSETVRS